MRLFPMAVVGGLLAVSVGLVSAETIRVRADAWMPFNGDPTSDKPGYVVELLKDAFKGKGVDIDYSTMPYAEALKAAEVGDVDAVIGANQTEGKALILPTESIGKPDTALFVFKGKNFDLEDVKGLAKVRIGVCEGYSYWPLMDKYIAQKPKNVRVFSGETPLKDAIDAMVNGELDAIPENRPVFIWALKEKGLQPGDFRTAFLFDGDPIFVAFSPKNPNTQKYSQMLSDHIKAMRASGKLRELLRKYGLTDWQN